MVVLLFLFHFAGQGQVPAALQALDRARRALRVETGRRWEGEMAALPARLRSGNIPRKAAGE